MEIDLPTLIAALSLGPVAVIAMIIGNKFHKNEEDNS